MEKRKYQLDASLGYKLFHASRLITNRLNQNFRSNQLPLTYEQWQIMSRLYEEDGQTQHSLAVRVERDQASVSRLIDNMVKRDLVKRVPHATDRRTNLIYLTQESRDMQEQLEEVGLQTIDEASLGIAPEDVEACMRVLDQIRRNLV